MQAGKRQRLACGLDCLAIALGLLLAPALVPSVSAAEPQSVSSANRGGLRMQYRCSETKAETNQVRCSLQIANDGETAVPLVDLTVRYWYARDADKSRNFWCDYAVLNKDNVSGVFGRLATPTENAAGFVQLAFTPGAGEIKPGGNSGEIQCRFAADDWSNVDQSKDYSLNAAAKDWTDNPHIAIYQKAKLVWGQDPGAKANESAPQRSSDKPTTGAALSSGRSLSRSASRPAVVATIPKPRGDRKYEQRFLDLWKNLHDPRNGYFSPEGIPYHSVETFMIEAPDYGHETTSEAASYWLWLEAKYGHLTGDWSKLNDAWDVIERSFIPAHDDQPTNSGYNASRPAQYAGEYETPSKYPSRLRPEAAVGNDPLAVELKKTYGTPDIYGMHWLLDCDNWYGFGRRGDGRSRPAFINTFQRGPMESVWATVPQPSWEAFRFGGRNGYLDLFTIDNNYSRQWRYTNAPDADARAVQAMFWAQQWAAQRGQEKEVALERVRRLGDYLRYAMFDKYFKKPGCHNADGDAGRDYQSAHYLLSWYYAWGGSIDPGNAWAWRIGSSHCHAGYQNPLVAWALANVDGLQPTSPNAPRDWQASLDRQLEFYRWLQSAEGAIAGGASNSWNGRYETPPANASTFYGMAYDWQPVYHDPPSNNWFGMQTWTMERIAELYYVTGDRRAGDLLLKWTGWAKEQIVLTTDGGYQIPEKLKWQGQPAPWNPAAPAANDALHCEVAATNSDIGIAASLARTLLYFSAGEKPWHAAAPWPALVARALLDRMWKLHRDDKGLSIEESRDDYRRVFEQTVYVPDGFSGKMPNGDPIQPGVKFIDLRSRYRDDPAFAEVERAYRRGEAPKFRYHRFWAQVEVALANAAAAELDTE